MSLVSPDLRPLRELVIGTARELLLPRAAGVEMRTKEDGSLVTTADELMQQELRTALAARWPSIPFLGEEMAPELQREALESGEGFWCLDPVDGTTNYALGVPFYAVSLAYIAGGSARLGVVYDPSRDECFSAAAGAGAWLNGGRLSCPPVPSIPLAEAVALIDFKRLPAGLATRLATDPPFRSLRSLGSVALEWCWMAAGRGQLYLHGRQRLWDFAAGTLVFAEAGGRCSTLAREPVFAVDLAPRSAVAACPGLFDAWLGWLDTAGATP